MTRWNRLLAVVAVLALLAAACGGDDDTTTESGTDGEAGASGDPVTVGVILVGPQNDRGYSQAHFEGFEYVEQELGAELIVIDKVNPADRPNTTVEQVVDDMIEQGADLVVATSDDMRDGILAAAEAHPDVPMVWASGDSAWMDGTGFREDLPNLGNVFGRMEYGKMMAGCSAALHTQTGSIGYLGPLINDETRRLVNSAFLGAQYCWENFRGEDPATLEFAVNWIGFWFNIPGVTLDPTQVANAFFDDGADVIISGIDTTEALVVAGQRFAADEAVAAVPYDYVGACEEAPAACLGVPYFNWGPAYLDIVGSVQDGSFAGGFAWLGPDWNDINDPATSTIGFVAGDGLGDAASQLDEFIAGLADGSIDLFTGPLNYQDGSEYLADGETATDVQIWYTEQLLEGIDGASSSN